MERKSNIHNILPPKFCPKTILIPSGLNKNDIEIKILQNQFSFPLIVKPDIGGKGRGVKKVNSINDAVQYITKSNFPMLVQELVPFENEVGIFYYRFPWQDSGTISGIVGKEFAYILGDGISTIEALILQNPRYVLQLSALKKMAEINFKEILADGVKKIIVPFGNHARGAKFIDVSKNITPALTKSIDEICKQIPQFYFGRLDVMYSSWDDLCQGKDLSIIELNGAGSEPTHIYDPSHSIFFAWGEIIRHLKILEQISRYNHKVNHIPYLSFKQGITMFKENKKVEKKLNEMF